MNSADFETVNHLLETMYNTVIEKGDLPKGMNTWVGVVGLLRLRIMELGNGPQVKHRIRVAEVALEMATLQASGR